MTILQHVLSCLYCAFKKGRFKDVSSIKVVALPKKYQTKDTVDRMVRNKFDFPFLAFHFTLKVDSNAHAFYLYIVII